MAELKENSEITKNVLERGNYKSKMNLEAWNINKGNLDFIPEELQKDLQHIRYLILEFNRFVEYDLHKLSHLDMLK